MRAPHDAVCRHALAIIREKDAHINMLDEDRMGWADEAVKAQMQVNEKDAEIERLTTENGILQKRLDEAETNFELLEDAVDDVSDDEVE